MTESRSWTVIRSRITRSRRVKPTRSWFWKQLAHAAQTAVAQVVNVVGGAHTGSHAAQVVDGGQNVICNDMLGDQVVPPLSNGLSPAALGNGIQQLPQDGRSGPSR